MACIDCREVAGSRSRVSASVIDASESMFESECWCWRSISSLSKVDWPWLSTLDAKGDLSLGFA